jgi:hypothetical protein
MRQWLGLRRLAGLTAFVTCLAVAFSFAPAAFAVSGAAFTSVNEDVDGTGHCQNGNPIVNCNIYDGKDFVWLNGGPATASVGDGSYFFAVLDPGGQADPNDASLKNLSSPNDAYTDRTFSVSGGTVSYIGPHDFDSTNGKIRLMPYDDTSNPGGVYILAICSLADGYPVDPSTCKYDAFKVNTGNVTSASDPTITKDANGSNTDTFTWGISKDADKTKVNSASGGVTFTYTVKVTHDSGTIGDVQVSGTISVFNPNVDDQNNTTPVDITEVTDQLSDGTVCSVTDGALVTLTKFQTDFDYSCDLSALPQGELNNTASVSWPAQLLSDGNLLGANSASFTFKSISFTETTVDNCVDVTDTVGGSLGSVCSSDPSPTSFTYQRTVDGVVGTCTDYDNTATFTTNDAGDTDSASKTVTVCRGADLTAGKTATGGFTRTYKWKITKVADATKKTASYGNVKFTYTVSVTSGTPAYVDSAWQVTGTITAYNPNDWEDVTANFSDSIAAGWNCTVTNGTNVTVPKASGGTAGSVSRDYSCTWSGVGAPSSGTNTATVSWNSGTAFTAHSSASGTATFSFTTATTEVYKTITVTDPVYGGGTPAGTLGTVTYGVDTLPKKFVYDRYVAVPTSGCTTYPNTATITETGQTASASVQACRTPAATGALTMGYWQNKNGQGIITGGASTAGVCNSGTWLRQYAPFQDLSSSASCSAVATYVYNLIKVANSSGAAMNAMLKAQMLATALDVYFSDPALGGNKISAPAPIGGVKIDLTVICKMIDGSSGSGTCSGTYSNASSAFGSATSLTVSQLLAYAASQSNVGGTTWYGNVKATQELAKNTFDAINNQVAFAAP